MTLRLLRFASFTFPLLFAGHVFAEKADSEKGIEIVAGLGCTVDSIKQSRVCNGPVTLTQGTLVMKGTKLVVETSPDGWEFSTLYAPANGKATVRQKRDGGPDLWMEGEAANRITYDQKTAVATLYNNAKVRRLTGTKTTDESEGAYLAYNSNTEIVTASNNETGVSKQGDGPVTIRIQPHDHGEKKDK